MTDQTEEQQPNPSQLAADEIRAIFEKHDLAGAYILCDPKGSMYRLVLTPTWSAVKLERDDVSQKYRTVVATIDDEKAARTAAMIDQIGQTCFRWLEGLQELAAKVERSRKVIHKAFSGPRIVS